MPCGTSFSIITAKIPFLSSLLISLCRDSINGVSCTKTDIFIYGDCLADMPVKLTDMPAELTGMPVGLADMPAEVR